MDREPHIGEYVVKTNAIGDCQQIPIASGLRRRQACGGDYRMLSLLPVVLQHHTAWPTQLRTILLKASQNGEFALIDQRATEALNVAGAGLLLLGRAAALLLGDGTGGNR